MSWQIIQGDCREVMRGMEADSVDAIVTDGPYGIHFMNKKWDEFGGWTGKRLIDQKPGTTTPALEAGTYDHSKNYVFQVQMYGIFVEVLRIAKPGAHLVAFGGPRTFHRLTCAIEDAGWQIRDCLMWLFGSGFPKSHNVAHAIDKRVGLIGNRGKAIPTASSYQATDIGRNLKLRSYKVPEYKPLSAKAEEYAGAGTALKPAWEPIILARKPFIGSVADNVIKYGTGILNIDACRIGSESVTINTFDDGAKPFGGGAGHEYTSRQSTGRWPANLVLDEQSAEMLDAESGECKTGDLTGQPRTENQIYNSAGSTMGNPRYHKGDSGGASRFFYTSKASKEEREAGLDSRDPINVTDGRKIPPDNAYQRGKTKRRNTHPTVKPLDLMRWLVRLVTPARGLVLDPFAGSGTTIMAARIEGRRGIGIELDESSAEIARKRVAYAGEIAGDATKDDAETMGDRHTQMGLKL